MQNTLQNVLIIDDHAVTRIGLKVLFKELFKDIQIDEAQVGSEAEQFIKNKEYEFCTLDLNMPDTDSVELLKKIKRLQPDIKVLVIGMNNEDIYAVNVLRNGANGFVSKENGFDIIKEAILKILDNKKYMSERVISLLLTDQGGAVTANPFHKLSERELEITKLLLDGCSTKKISEAINLQISTVSTHKNRIFEKLQVTNSIELYELSRLHHVGSSNK